MVRIRFVILPKTTGTKFIFGRTAARFILTITSVGVIGCVVQSPEPEVEDIIKVSAPTFGGKSDTFISSPSQTYSLSGECDVNAKVTEYTFDQVTWTALTCVNGKFSIPIVLTGFADVWARSSGKFSRTTTSHARIRFLLPPTSDAIIAGNSSKSANSDSMGAGTQNMMAASFEGNSIQDSSLKVQTMLPRMVYEQ